MKRLLPRALSAMLVMVLFAAAVCAADSTSVDARRKEIKGKILPKVAALRGLAYINDVPIKVVTPTRLEKYIRKNVDENMTDVEFRGYEKMLVYLGLLQPGTDLKETLIKAYSQQVAGFYDDDDKSFSIVEGSSMPAEMDAVTIAHELTHALQDQHFGLSEMDDYTEHDDDASLAVGALAEGDACEIMLRYATGTAPRGKGPVLDYTRFMSLSLGPESMPGMPLILSQDMLFPYTYGTRFISNLLKTLGPDGPNMAFRDPPVSTAQIIEPDKYFRRQEPYILELPDLTKSLGAGWKRIDQEPLGQFDLGIYISVTTGSWGVDDAIRQWRGDMLAGYGGPEDADFFMVYKSTWNSYEGAEAFRTRYARLIEARFGDAKRTYEDAERVMWMRGGNLYYLGRKGCDVLVIENIPRDKGAEAILASWDAPKVPFGIVRPIADTGRVQPAGTIPAKPAKGGKNRS